MSLRTLTTDIASQLAYKNDVSGVVVTGVESFGPAARAGLHQKDIITRVQGVAVDTVNEFQNIIQENDLKKGVRLRVRNGDTQRYVLLRVDG